MLAIYFRRNKIYQNKCLSYGATKSLHHPPPLQTRKISLIHFRDFFYEFIFFLVRNPTYVLEFISSNLEFIGNKSNTQIAHIAMDIHVKLLTFQC